MKIRAKIENLDEKPTSKKTNFAAIKIYPNERKREKATN